MDIPQITIGIKLLAQISSVLNKAEQSDEEFCKILNNLPQDIKQQNVNNYRNKQDKPVGACRFELAQKLFNGQSLTPAAIEEVMKSVEEKYKKDVFRVWGVFGICYPLYYDQYVKEVNRFISELISKLKADLNYPEAKNTIVDFKGPRNFGSSRCWFAIFNHSHEKQDTAKQLLLSVDNNEISYGAYFYPNRTYLSTRTSVNPEDFDYEKLLQTYRDSLNLIVNDEVDNSEAETINIVEGVRYFIGGANWEGQDYTKEFIDKGYWENGYDDKFKDEIKDVPLGSKIAIKSTYAKGSDSTLRIKCIGTVIDNPKDGKDLIVKWQQPFEMFDISGLGSYRQTFHEIIEYNDIRSIFFSDNNLSIEQSNIKTQNPLNQILYGPPGTGKTYHTINLALAILENSTIDAVNKEENISGRKLLVSRFENYRQKDFVEFITFHQNYNYEEFVQGLRPVLAKEGKETDSLRFKKEDGIFKKIADRAYKNFVGEAVEEKKITTFNELLTKFLEPLKTKDEIEIGLQTSKFFITGENEKYISFRNVNGNPAKINKIYLEMALQKGTLKGIVEGGLETYYAPILNKLTELKSQIESEYKLIEPHNFVLIIDEINRANISRVFGELITLLEEDKRWDNEHKLKIKLPSGDEFTVPKNLYIIGTMNTADKSIALLDIALRRRFDFVPMYPDENLVKADFKDFFISLNQAIKKERGADFAIGHSYLMESSEGKIFDFAASMNRKIIPLLNEYFYSAKDGKVKELIENALRAGNLEGNFSLVANSLGILSIQPS